jgi:outer membrane receptor protein involved in Fe transport
MKKRHFGKIIIASAALASVLGIAVPRAMSAALEEIIVTAQKREEGLNDVPIAITARTGESMRAGGIDKLEALAPSVPAFQVSEGYGGDSVSLRGLGSGNNSGFEEAVGYLIDGFYYGRSRFGRSQFLDTERVEILKGPQGALIGKNTTAGAVNITSAVPTDEFSAWISAQVNVEASEGEIFEGAISGPLSDTLKGRIAFRAEDRDGFMDNKTTGDEDQSVEDYAGRAILHWDPSDEFSLKISYTGGDFERFGKNAELTKCTANILGFMAGNGVTTEDCKKNHTRSAVAPRNGVGNFELTETTYNTFGLTMAWEFEKFRVVSLTGVADYDYEESGNVIHVPVEFFETDVAEDYSQTTQEFRIESMGDQTVDFIAGFFYQRHELETDLDLHVIPAGAKNRWTHTEQDGDTYAIFGQITWHINDAWDLTFGGRFTREDKDARSTQTPSEIYSRIPLDPVPPQDTGGGPAASFYEHDIKGDRTEENFSPTVVTTWRPDDDTMYYASIKTGFKGGGFDHWLAASQAQVDANGFSFDEEEVLAFEVGGKHTLMSGEAQFNWSLFHSRFDDLQVIASVGVGQFFVSNAATAISQGLEMDFEWAITDAWTLTTAVTFLDAEFDEFEEAPCSADQNLTGNCPNGVQDLSNKELTYSPDYSYTISLQHVLPISESLELISFIQVYGADEQALALDLDPNTFEGSHEKVDARLTLASTDRTWEISLIGRNLTDEVTGGFANDLPGFDGSYFRMIEAPRTIAVKGVMRF